MTAIRDLLGDAVQLLAAIEVRARVDHRQAVAQMAAAAARSRARTAPARS